MRILLLFFLMVTLTGCPGGWREKMISTYSLEPVAPDAVLTHHGYGFGDLIAPPYLLDGVLYLQMFSSNPHDLAFDQPTESLFQINGLIAAAIPGVTIDSRSFRILKNNDENKAIEPSLVEVAYERTYVQHYMQEPRNVCGFLKGTTTIESTRLSVPKFKGGQWPPYNIDDSVLCASIGFPVSIRDIPPQKQFQLKFTYYVSDIPHEATLYFYPFKYTVFEH